MTAEEIRAAVDVILAREGIAYAAAFARYASLSSYGRGARIITLTGRAATRHPCMSDTSQSTPLRQPMSARVATISSALKLKPSWLQ